MPDSSLAGTWSIDPSHTRIGFSTRHAMVTRVRGAFNEVSGSVFFDPEQPESSRAELTIQMDSVDTRTPDRDKHLRSADFFDVENHPTMTFTSTRIEEVDDGGFVVIGDLTLKDVTKSLSVPLSLLGVDTDPFGNVRAGFEGSRRLDRREFGITWNTPLDSGGLLVSDRVQLEFELSFIKDA